MDGIVITGRGVVSPVATGVEAFFDALLGMEGGISDEAAYINGATLAVDGGLGA